MLCNITPSYETGGEVLQSCHCLQTAWASVCSWEVVSAFPSLTTSSSSFFLSLPYETVFILTHAFFLLLPFRLSPPSHIRGSKREAGWVFSGWPGSTHHLQKSSEERMRRKWDASYWTNCHGSFLQCWRWKQPNLYS